MIRTRAFASLLAATMFVGCAPRSRPRSSRRRPSPIPSRSLRPTPASGWSNWAGWPTSTRPAPPSSPAPTSSRIGSSWPSSSISCRPDPADAQRPGDARGFPPAAADRRLDAVAARGRVDGPVHRADGRHRFAGRAARAVRVAAAIFAEQGEIAKPIDAMAGRCSSSTR